MAADVQNFKNSPAHLLRDWRLGEPAPVPENPADTRKPGTNASGAASTALPEPIPAEGRGLNWDGHLQAPLGLAAWEPTPACYGWEEGELWKHGTLSPALGTPS